jgi:hypothetical protein
MVDDGLVRPVRRSFTVARKLDILEEYEKADPLGRGALLRREASYTSTISQWRHARDTGRWAGGQPRRGPAPRPETVKRIEELEAETARLRAELATARQVVKVQGELAALLETLSASSATPNAESRPRR